MNTFILILTLVVGYTNGGGISTAEFSTLESCTNAGTEWVNKGPRNRGSVHKHFICVPKGDTNG